jgi:guanine deaminase
MPTFALPGRPPFALRARVLSPLAGGGTLHEADGIVAVDEAGRLAYVGPVAGAPPGAARSAVDVRPWVVMPGLVDTHAHLPQLPNAGLGFALDLLTWLDRLTFPTERSWADPAAKRSLTSTFRAFAAAGTTTVMAYGVVYEAAMDGVPGGRGARDQAVLGKVMMDRVTYDSTIERSTILERTLRESAGLISRWHGAADGRLGYAVTPRFAVSCTAELLRESASLARSTGAWWQSHVSEDAGEIAEVARQFPEALDYVDVYDRAGALGPRSVLAHAIHLSDREVARLVETDTRVAHCPASNLFIGAGVMPLSRWLEAGIAVGLGSDVSGGPDPSIFGVMRVGRSRRWGCGRSPASRGRRSRRSTGSSRDDRGSAGDRPRRRDRLARGRQEADLIVVDPQMTSPLRGAVAEDPALLDESDALVSRLIFRPHPDMVRGAWVRGRRLEGPS